MSSESQSSKNDHKLTWNRLDVHFETIVVDHVVRRELDHTDVALHQERLADVAGAAYLCAIVDLQTIIRASSVMFDGIAV